MCVCVCVCKVGALNGVVSGLLAVITSADHTLDFSLLRCRIYSPGSSAAIVVLSRDYLYDSRVLYNPSSVPILGITC